MKSKLFFVVGLVTVLFISTPVFAQQEEITLSTYYPAPYGEYDELCAEKLLVDLPSAAELQDMARGDCHITRSLIVGAGGGGFSYDELNAAGLPLYDGDVIIKGYVGIGTTKPDTKLGIAIASAANVNDGLKIFRPDFNGSPNYNYLKFGMKSDNNVLYRGAISYVYNYGAENEIMTFRITTGNVGIGTTDPTFKLDVSGGSSDDVLRITTTRNVANSSMAYVYANRGAANVANGDLARITFQHDTTGGSVMKAGIESVVEDNTSTAGLGLAFRTGGVTSEAVRITKAGNVGIGTTNPTAKLSVAGNIASSGSAGVLTTPSYNTIGWKTVTVTFPTAFSTPPTVVITNENYATGDFAIRYERIKNVTTTGFQIDFDIAAFTAPGGTTKWHWIAIQSS